MQTRLTEEMRQNARALEADSILRACVHCGFCTATCPTYQLLGDELDGPRGRIYLIKQVLEGNEVTLKTQEHLDRCLTCRNCETTCPSGVRYHNLLDIGRDIVEQKVKRPLPERMLREGLRQVVPRPAVFRALTQVGLVLRPFLPEQVRAKLPAETVKAKPRPPLRHKRRVLMLEGCAQPTLSPNTNAATARVLDRLGISVMPANEAGCCVYNSHDKETGGRAIMTKGRKTTFEERVEIVQYCIKHSHNYSETAKKFHISYQQARSYTIRYEENGVDGLQDKRGKRKSPEEMTEVEKLRAEVRLLRAEKRRAEIEISFLKKLEEIERRGG